MAQVTSGIRAILSSPKVYDLFQIFMGAQSVRQEFVREHIQPLSGYRSLDSGCATAIILYFLPEVQYYGFDLSQRYMLYNGNGYGKTGFGLALLEEE